jgi:hypothetical protein
MPTDAPTHECGCATFGPGPHPVDARHRNARGCEHAETGFTEADLAAALEEVDAFEGDENVNMPNMAAAIFAALGAASQQRLDQEKGEAGS